MDGELVIGSNFQDTASGVMTFDGKPDFKYRVFDFFGDGAVLPFHQRYEKLLQICADFTHYKWLELVLHKKMYSLLDVNDYEAEQLAKGKEGIMLRSMEGVYKFGRSTAREQGLLKLKRFTDADARVIGFDELHHNDNDQTSDARGYAERSSHQDSMIPGDTLGALVCRHSDDKTIFRIGTGFTAAERQEIWNNQDRYRHRIVTYKYQPFGVKEAPRAPVFLRWKVDSEL
jgi:DNA ligase-1